MLKKDKAKGENKIITVIVSLFLTIVVFIGLLIVQKNIISPHGKATVYIATQDLSKGTLITKENINSLFTTQVVDGQLKVSNAVDNKNNLIDHVVTENLNKGTVIAKNYFLDKNNILNKIDNPTEVSFTTNDVSNVLGGVIREGDLINISIVNKDNRSKELLKNAYVTKVFAQDNTELKRGDDKPSMTINIIIPGSLVQEFNTGVSNGNIRVSMSNNK
ncbi:SAF domain-containing protein [Clostridium baratii]|uniref:Flp pilus assembly protein CpaB n=1 Tax=Clostridium baratii TaxID=1561 RepID=A0A174VF49_9CLOT|nr:SAF domain-containing protein [Clostridium baratii]CUQ30718.1 Flp pilus assembly protein CpaB [Clostridium baratii]